MPSQRYFDQCAVFPSDVLVEDVPTVSLKQLEGNDQGEEVKLFDACCGSGFFMIDLRESQQGECLLKDAESMFDLTWDTLTLDKAVLKAFAYKPPKDLLGYKEVGQLRTDDDGVDATEMYTLGQDDVLGTVLPQRKNPEPIEERRPECRQFLEHAYSTITIILSALNRQLSLPEGTLTNLISPTKASGTGLRLLLVQPQEAAPAKRITLGAHTDIGVITLLFNVAGGLQVLPADSENTDGNWRFVRPQMGCAFVNLGDTIVEWTGGVLRSSLHRVITAPGKQNNAARISLAYVIRSAYGESMRRLRGDGIPLPNEGEEDDRTADEWAAERAYQIGQGILKPRTHGGLPTTVN